MMHRHYGFLFQEPVNTGNVFRTDCSSANIGEGAFQVSISPSWRSNRNCCTFCGFCILHTTRGFLFHESVNIKSVPNWLSFGQYWSVSILGHMNYIISNRSWKWEVPLPQGDLPLRKATVLFFCFLNGLIIHGLRYGGLRHSHHYKWLQVAQPSRQDGP
jgi:hypothetical protein